jgi:hypothetical protein
MKTNLIFTGLIFRGRITQKIRIRDIFSFQIPAQHQSSSFISPSVESLNLESLQPKTNLIESPNLTKESLQLETTATRPFQVYRRRIQPDQTLLQAQESELK